MKQTDNYKLNMPEGNDTVDIDVLNDNMEILDGTIKNVSDTLGEAAKESTLQGVKADVAQVKNDVVSVKNGMAKETTLAEVNNKIGKNTDTGNNTLFGRIRRTVRDAEGKEYYPVMKVTANTLVAKGESDVPLNAANDISDDNDFVYISTPNTIIKYNKIDLGIVSRYNVIGEQPKDIRADESNVYCNIWHNTSPTFSYILKLDKLTMTKTAQSASFDTNEIRCMGMDSKYLYCALSSNKIIKINKSDLTQAGETAVMTRPINVMAIDESYLYCGENAIRKIIKVDKTTMTKTGETEEGYGDAAAVVVDDRYIYACGNSNLKVVRFDKTTMKKTGETDAQSNTSSCIEVDEKHIYYANVKNIIKFDKLTMGQVGQTMGNGQQANKLLADNNCLYAHIGGKIVKFDKNHRATYSVEQYEGAV